MEPGPGREVLDAGYAKRILGHCVSLSAQQSSRTPIASLALSAWYRLEGEQFRLGLQGALAQFLGGSPGSAQGLASRVR